jgi:GDP-D-mannose 3',5'-epimerase
VKKILVLGGGGFIGSHLVNTIKSADNYIVTVDLVSNPFMESLADRIEIGDLRNQSFVAELFQEDYDEVYQLAADMGGAGYIFTGENDADIMHNSAQINLNVAHALKNTKTKLFYSSSACIYPEENQLDAQNPNCEESSAFPANPDSEYGWEKLFSERLYLNYAKNYGLNVRIARFHNVFGPYGLFDGGKEKAPAAIARKVAQAKEGESIEIWGSGNQTRSFLYIEECVEGIQRLMDSEYMQPINIGSDEMVSINELAQLTIALSGKSLSVNNIKGPVGVNGRCSDNRLISKTLGWAPNYSLKKGMKHLYDWVNSQL